MAESATTSGTRSRTSAAFAGSLTTIPSGTMLPAVSPMRYALKASTKPRRCGASKQSVQAKARTPNRAPASARMSRKPAPIFEILFQTSHGPARHTK